MKSAIRDPDPVIFLENELMYGVAFPVSQEVCSLLYASLPGNIEIALSVVLPYRSSGSSNGLNLAQEVLSQQ